MDQQALFPTPEKGEATWHKSFEIGRGQRLEIPLYISLIEGELRDQVSLKSSVRKAALRASQKTIQRLARRGLSHLNDQEMAQLRWSLFICHVDRVLAGQHLKLRQDGDALRQLARDPAFSP